MNKFSNKLIPKLEYFTTRVEIYPVENKIHSGLVKGRKDESNEVHTTDQVSPHTFRIGYLWMDGNTIVSICEVVLCV
jgi:hypothetical protein